MVTVTSTRGRRVRVAAAVLASAALLLTGCTVLPGQPTASPTASASADPGTVAQTTLGAEPCEDDPTLLCGTLTVPLDHDNPDAVLATPTATPGATAAPAPAPATLDLAVTLTADEAPRGVLLVLSGGPGQPGTNVVSYFRDKLPEVAAQYQLIGIDQRGTGANAIDCPAVQRETGSSDLLSANSSAVVSCGNELEGTRQFYSTADTVKDLDALRSALGLSTWAIDGISYGTFVAEQYALNYPQATSALVLDSVVPQDGIDPFSLSSMSEASRVLTAVCALEECESNPAGDIAKVISDGYDALGLLDAIVSLSVSDPTMPGVIDALATARTGKWGALDKLVASVAADPDEPIEEFSAGLHIATICTDTTMPWGDSASDPASRLGALGSAVNEIKSEQTWPFPTTLPAEVGSVTACQNWPQTEFGARASGTLPNIPILLLAGELDLSTPIAEAQKQLEITPSATLRVISGSGHAVQTHPAGQDLVTRFLVSD